MGCPLAISRLGKDRESNTFTAEVYKRDIRRYLEIQGYAQTTDSFYEGHPVDMRFIAAHQRDGPDLWVEAKATSLSLADAAFRSEFRGYLKTWMRLPPSRRFLFKVFARELVNPRKWDSVFGSALGEKAITDWLTLNPEVDEDVLLAKRLDEVLSFFTEAEIVVGDAATLREVTEEKQRNGIQGADLQSRARQMLNLMEGRGRPAGRKSVLIANLVKFQPPKTFRELHVDPLPTDQIRSVLSGVQCPPFYVMERGRVLTFDVPGVEGTFSKVNGTPARQLTLVQAEREENALRAILNGAVSRAVFSRGAGKHRGAFFFLARDEVATGRPRVIESTEGEYTVAKPLYQRVSEETQAEQEGLAVADGRSTRVGDLNFVFHEGFTAYVRQWDGYYVEIKPHRVYTTDGGLPLEDRHADRIDRLFRKPMYNRSDSHLRKLKHIAAYIFERRDKDRVWQDWLRAFSFNGLLQVKTRWSPEPIKANQSFIDGFVESERDD